MNASHVDARGPSDSAHDVQNEPSLLTLNSCLVLPHAQVSREPRGRAPTSNTLGLVFTQAASAVFCKKISHLTTILRNCTIIDNSCLSVYGDQVRRFVVRPQNLGDFADANANLPDIQPDIMPRSGYTWRGLLTPFFVSFLKDLVSGAVRSLILLRSLHLPHAMVIEVCKLSSSTSQLPDSSGLSL